MSDLPLQPPAIRASQQSVYYPLPTTGSFENLVVLTNLEEKKITFKVKTTTRERYSVKPRSGVLHPRESVRIRFIVVYMCLAINGQVPNESCRDRFVIEARFVQPDETVDDAESLWAATCKYNGKLPVAKTSLAVRYGTPQSLPATAAYFPRRDIDEAAAANHSSRDSTPSRPRSTESVQSAQDKIPSPALPPHTAHVVTQPLPTRDTHLPPIPSGRPVTPRPVATSSGQSTPRISVNGAGLSDGLNGSLHIDTQHLSPSIGATGGASKSPILHPTFHIGTPVRQPSTSSIKEPLAAAERKKRGLVGRLVMSRVDAVSAVGLVVFAFLLSILLA